jgi:hypothetical protein
MKAEFDQEAFQYHVKDRGWTVGVHKPLLQPRILYISLGFFEHIDIPRCNESLIYDRHPFVRRGLALVKLA